MKTFYISFAISGTGQGYVEAETEDEAIKKAKLGEYTDPPEIVEWEINSEPYRGGYLEATEER